MANPERILELLSDIRNAIPPQLRAAAPAPAAPISLPPGATVEDFELATVAEGISQVHDELVAAIERAHADALASALRIYYAAEELSRDPANAHLLPQVEEMRRAYERDFGVPIPAAK